MDPSSPVSRNEVWNSLREDYVSQFGVQPTEPPDFMEFLKRLRPSTGGGIECPPCRMFYDGRFELHELKDHFHYCHLGNISDADQKFMKPRVSEALSQLMQDPEIEQTLQSLLDNYSVDKPP